MAQMENNQTEASGNSLELCLIEQEIFGSLILIVSYILIIISAEQDRQEILNKNQVSQVISSNVKPSTLAAIASYGTLLGVLILGSIAFTRLKELQRKVQEGTSKTSLIPNIYISAGYALSILANAIKAIGAQLRADEEQRITIL